MDFDRDGLEGFDLKGKILGVVGCGAIGKHVVKIGRGFDMNVLIYDVKVDQAFVTSMGAKVAESLDSLLAQSDVITLHVPYISGKTHHLINRENVKQIKPGAILVNTARGAIVDTEALLWALQKKILSGAGLDVLEEENDTFEDVKLLSEGFSQEYDIATLLRNHILAARKDVIITPHNAFNSREAKHNILMTTIENIQAYIKNQPINVVSK
jgi:D-lactate dehydrogenase